LKAHYQQAATLIRRNEEYGNLFEVLEEIAEREGLNLRMLLPLFDLALGLRITNSRYQKGAEVTQYVASRDLKVLCDIGLIEPHGENRGRYYTAGKEITAAREKVRLNRNVANPYDLVEERSDTEPRLPGV
jgi:hypothetical protein